MSHTYLPVPSGYQQSKYPSANSIARKGRYAGKICFYAHACLLAKNRIPRLRFSHELRHGNAIDALRQAERTLQE